MKAEEDLFKEEGVQALKDVRYTIVIPNDRLLQISDNNVSKPIYKIRQDFIKRRKRISGLITQPGVINVDFADKQFERYR